LSRKCGSLEISKPYGTPWLYHVLINEQRRCFGASRTRAADELTYFRAACKTALGKVFNSEFNFSKFVCYFPFWTSNTRTANQSDGRTNITSPLSVHFMPSRQGTRATDWLNSPASSELICPSSVSHQVRLKSCMCLLYRFCFNLFCERVITGESRKITDTSRDVNGIQ
jgi:hypothetical protein